MLCFQIKSSSVPTIFDSYFRIEVKWFDSRITFINLKLNKTHGNNVDKVGRESVWIPQLIFKNCIQDYFIQNDELSTLTVKRKGEIYSMIGSMIWAIAKLSRLTWYLEKEYDFKFKKQYWKFVIFHSGLPRLSLRSQLSKDEIFDGSENPFVYSRYYELAFNCDFQFQNYPFDYQKCYIKVCLVQGNFFLSITNEVVKYWQLRSHA